jgi:hypothetical protein
MPEPGNELMTAAEYRQSEGQPSERQLQESIVQWAEVQGGAASLLHAIPNGQYRPGQRREPGMTPGIPDLCLPVPDREGRHLYIELKVGSNTLTDAQEKQIRRLREHGNRVEVCRRLDEAIEVIREHLGL